MRRNLLTVLALVILCAAAARWLPHSRGKDYPASLARLPSQELTIAGVRPGMSKTALLKSMGRPASYRKVREGAVLEFSRVTVLVSADRVLWVCGTELLQEGQRVRAGGDPDEVMRALPGFEVVKLARDGRTTLLWLDSNLRSDTVLAVDAWDTEYALGSPRLLRGEPPDGRRLLPF